MPFLQKTHPHNKTVLLKRCQNKNNNNKNHNKVSGLKGQGSVEPHSLILQRSKISLSGTSIIIQKQNELQQAKPKQSKNNNRCLKQDANKQHALKQNKLNLIFNPERKADAEAKTKEEPAIQTGKLIVILTNKNRKQY